MNDIKKQIANLSNDYGEENDCTVRALAVALDGDYKTAHQACKAQGRKKGKGLNIVLWKRAFLDCGYELDDVTNNFDGQTIRTVERELAARRDDKKFLLNVRSHVCAWDGKEIVDWAAGRLHRIQNVFHIRHIATEEKMRVLEKVAEPVVHSDLRDMTFVMYEPGRSRDGDWRIYIRENGKVRWLNTKHYECFAEEAADNAARRRYIEFWGVVNSLDDLPNW
jgi:hypothetical protein